MYADIDRILISHQRIADKVQQLAAQITADHSPDKLNGGEVTILPIMTGAMIFCADLIRNIPIAMQIGLMTVSSYPGQSTRSQGAQLLANRLGNVRNRHVLILDDILDSGGTLRAVTPLIHQAGAASVKTCVLLRKDRPVAMQTHVDYVGFDIPDEFVVGYGLDYNDYYRNLPDIVTLRPQVLAGQKKNV